ncbi:hypothetical protein LEP1GSC170_3562 [Leptospira interrogans serovar Bataviae str. HAI135]|nr:hypothetical protein LEP1GSC170_3562 [Leptospira interrogans serovar Bataviae str. HAI135]
MRTFENSNLVKFCSSSHIYGTKASPFLTLQTQNKSVGITTNPL